MVFFPVMVGIVTGLIALNTEFPEVHPQEIILGDGDASISWPVVNGSFSGVSRINEILNYKYVTGETLEETGENYREYGRGIIGSYFVVNHTDTEFLDLTITVETLGAYPDAMVFNYCFNLDTGEEVVPEDMFMENKIQDLVQMCNTELQNRISSEIQTEYTFEEENLNQLGIRRGGIVFHYDFGFPHSTVALEPDGELFFYWSDLNGFLLPDARR